MRTKTALKIRLLNAEGKSLRQIAEAVDLSADEVEDYLLTAGLTQEQREHIQTEFERGTRVAEIAAKFSRDVSYIYKLRREWRAEQTKTQEDKSMNTESTTKTPAPAATGTDEKDNKIGVITNDNDTTNCRACQVGSLSMSTGGGKSYMMTKALHETEEK